MSDLDLGQLRSAAERERQAREAVDAAIGAARAAGASWPAIGEALGVSAEAARWRHRAAEGEPSTRSPRPPSRSTSTPSPGVSVSEAAERLGVTRMTVYRQVRSGRLDHLIDEAGHIRVLLPDAAGS